MLEQMETTNHDLKEEDIHSFEKKWRIILPMSYRQFLLSSNGGRPTPQAFPISGFPEDSIGAIQLFFGIGDDIPSADLDYILGDRPPSVPKELLPIACTDGADYVCIDLRREGAPVVFWDRRPFWGNEIWDEHYLYSVSPNFSELLNSLMKNPYL